MQRITIVSGHGHLIEVNGTGDDFACRVVCPDGGTNCECWIECQQAHPCNCGPHPHDDDCPAGCDEDHALECDEWVWNDEELHGEEHRYVSGMLCVRDTGCWMPECDLEFDQREDWPVGLYEFDYEAPDDDMGGCLYIVAMRPHAA